MFSNQHDRPNQVVDGFLIKEIVEIKPDPTRPQYHLALGDSGFQAAAVVHIHVQQCVPVRARTGTAPPGLNAEQIIQQGNNEAVVQILIPVLNAKRDNCQTISFRITQHVNV